MTIETESTSKKSAGQTFASTEKPQAGTFARQSQSFGSLSSRGLLGGLSFNPASEVLATAEKQIGEAIKREKRPTAIIAIDTTVHTNLRLSSVVIAEEVTFGNKRLAAFHTLVLAGSGQLDTERQVNLHGKTISVPVYTETAYDNVYKDAVMKVLTDKYPDHELIDCSATVVPKAFNWEDQAQVRRLLVNSTAAVLNALTFRSPDYAPIDLTKYDPSIVLQVVPAFNQDTTFDAVGNPIRSDVTISLNEVQPSAANKHTLNAGSKTEQIGLVTGFMNLSFAGGDLLTRANQNDTTTHAARFVMTGMLNQKLMTVNDQVLMILASAMMLDGKNWYRAALPRYGVAGDDLRDITALNIEANLEKSPTQFGAKVPLNPSNIEFELASFLGRVVRPEVSLALDVPRAAPSTWYNEVFAAAGCGDQGANEAILIAMDQLTGGNLSRILNGNMPSVFLPQRETVLMGHYTDSSGQHDLREIDDLLAVLNLQGSADPRIGAYYTETYYGAAPEEIRLQQRAELLRQLKPNAEITAEAYRLTFNNALLSAFLQAFSATNRKFQLVGQTSSNFSTSRPTGSWTGQQSGINASVFGYGSNSNSNGGTAFGQTSFGGSWKN
jgi:hypothetical protein